MRSMPDFQWNHLRVTQDDNALKLTPLKQASRTPEPGARAKA